MTDPQTQLAERLTPLHADGAPLAERVFDIIGDAIVTGLLAPGEKVNDKELATALGVSRTPVREALQRLTWVGLVEMSPSRFTRVTVVTDESVESTLEYAGVQAGVALRLAMGHMGEADISAAMEALDAMIAASEASDMEGLFHATRALMTLLLRNSGNRIFTRVMTEVDLLVARNLRHLRELPGSAPARVDGIRSLREAILTGDVATAEHLLRALHVTGFDTAG